MASNEVVIRFKVQDDGSIAVLDQAGQKMRGLAGAADTATTATKSFAAAYYTAAAAIGAAVLVGKRAVEAYIEQERATTLLNTALRGAGQYSAEYSKRLQEQATALMHVTTTGDEAILGIQRQLVLFGASETQIKQLTETILDFATGMGVDAHTATVAFGKALQGNFTYFQRFGIHIREGVADAEKWNDVMQAMARFQGQARAEGETLGGQMQILRNEIGEVFEALGAAVAGPGQAHLRWLSDAAKLTAEWIAAQNEETAVRAKMADIRREEQYWAQMASAQAVERGDWGEAFRAKFAGKTLTYEELRAEALRRMARSRELAGLPGTETAASLISPTTDPVLAALGRLPTGNAPDLTGGMSGAGDVTSQRMNMEFRLLKQRQDAAKEFRTELEKQQEITKQKLESDTADKLVLELQLDAQGAIVDQAKAQLATAEELARRDKDSVTLAEQVLDARIAEKTVLLEMAQLKSEGVRQAEAELEIARARREGLRDEVAIEQQRAAISRAGSNLDMIFGAAASAAGLSPAGNQFFGALYDVAKPALSQAAAGLGIGTAAAGAYTAGALLAIETMIGGLQERKRAQWKLGTTTEEIMRAMGDSAGPILDTLMGTHLGTKIALGTPVLGGVMRNWFQPKTTGAVIKKGLDELLDEALIPQSRAISGGGRSGIRTKFLEAPLTPEANAIMMALGYPSQDILTMQGGRPGLLGAQILPSLKPGLLESVLPAGTALGQILSRGQGGPQAAGNAANALANNFAALGLSAATATEYVKDLYQAASIDLPTGMQELNRQFIEGSLGQTQFLSDVKSLVELFTDDLPSAIDAAKLVLHNFSTDAGVDIANLAKDTQRAMANWQTGTDLARQLSEAAYTGATSLTAQVQASRYGAMTGREQGRWLLTQTESLDEKIQRLTIKKESVGLNYAEEQQLYTYLTQRGQYGIQYAEYAGQRYRGSMRTAAMERGWGIAETSAAGLETLGNQMFLVYQKNTDATDLNTEAINNLSAVMFYGATNRSLSAVELVQIYNWAKDDPLFRSLIYDITRKA